MRRSDHAVIILAGSGLWALAASVFLSHLQILVAAYTRDGFENDVIWIVERCAVFCEMEVYDQPWGKIIDGSLSC